jgi:hypothetical protein
MAEGGGRQKAVDRRQKRKDRRQKAVYKWQ